MKFIDALALVFSRYRRIAHGSWDSWAREQLQRDNDAKHSDQRAAGHKGLGLQASDGVATVQRHGEAIAGADSAEVSAWDLNTDWQAFRDAHGGDVA